MSQQLIEISSLYNKNEMNDKQKVDLKWEELK